MDTSSPAVFVNGELLRMFIGRKVRIVVQVMQSDAGSIFGKSTDNQQVIIKNSQPTQPLTTYVEAIGIADSNQSVRAEILTNFGDNFGMLTSTYANKIFSSILSIHTANEVYLSLATIHII